MAADSVFKVAITGPESTGKSVLALALGAHFQEPVALEFAREYLVKTSGRYGFADLDAICRGQLANEERACADAKKLCFCDTDITVLKIWSQYRFGKVSSLITETHRTRRYDLYLLCQTDLPWYPDQLRESPDPAERRLLFELYRQELDEQGACYEIVSGTGPQRIAQAIELVNFHFTNRQA